MPRSGTNWVSQFFASSPHIRVKFCPLFSYPFKNSMTEENDTASWQDFFNRVYVTQDEFMDQIYLSRKGLLPVFKNKHETPGTLLIKSNRFHHLSKSLLKEIPDLRMIALVRNPLAVISSWLQNPAEFPSGADPLKEWRTGSCRKNGVGEYWGFNDWLWVTSLHLELQKAYPDRFFLYRYEDVVQDPHQQARDMFSQIEVPYSVEVDQFIENSSSYHVEHPRSVFKKNQDVNKWKDNLDPRISASIRADLANSNLTEFLNEDHD